MPWVVRKVLRHARLSLELCQTTTNGPTNVLSAEVNSNGDTQPSENSKSVTTLRIKQTVNPGGFDSQGSYVVDGSTQDLSLPIFGNIQTRLKIVETSEIVDEVIRRKFEEANCGGKVIQELARNVSKGWEAEVIWTFESIDGKRYLTRDVSTANDEKKVIARMVYDSPS